MLFLLAFLAGALVSWRLGIIDDLLSPEPLPDDGRPALLATTYSDRVFQPHATVMQQLSYDYHYWRKRLAKKNPAAWRYAPRPVEHCSVYGFLNQCMEMSGTHYLVAREVQTIDFGYTNTLNGAQWVAAFEQALRDADILLIHESSGIVKVIPKAKIPEYRKAGLVSREE